MINIFQLTTCNYSEGRVPLIPVFLTADSPFQVAGMESNGERALFVLFCIWHTCSSASGL